MIMAMLKTKVLQSPYHLNGSNNNSVSIINKNYHKIVLNGRNSLGNWKVIRIEKNKRI